MGTAGLKAANGAADTAWDLLVRRPAHREDRWVPAPPRVNSRTITAILLEAGVVTSAQVDEGLALQRRTGRRIGESLVELGAVTEEDIGWALAQQLGLPFVDVQL